MLLVHIVSRCGFTCHDIIKVSVKMLMMSIFGPFKGLQIKNHNFITSSLDLWAVVPPSLTWKHTFDLH